METALGLRCHLCECLDYAVAHPVPLPENPEMLRDLASIGVPGAAEKLSRMPNVVCEPSWTHDTQQPKT